MSAVVYIVASAAPPVHDLTTGIDQLKQRGYQPCVVLTPTATTWVDTDDIATATGFPVRVQSRLPGEVDPLPPADAVIAVSTFNTFNKWALGISDNLALGLLNEHLGIGVPIVAAPIISAKLRAHPAYPQSRRTLQTAGAHVLEPEDIRVYNPDGTVATVDWARIIDALHTLTYSSETHLDTQQ